MPILEARKVSKVYQMGTTSVTALNDVSLVMNEGEFVSIQGTSGSGKSTLLNMVGGLDHPTSGDVFFNAQPLGPFSKKEMARYRRYSGSGCDTRLRKPVYGHGSARALECKAR